LALLIILKVKMQRDILLQEEGCPVAWLVSCHVSGKVEPSFVACAAVLTRRFTM
jgi:hypothetical protein